MHLAPTAALLALLCQTSPDLDPALLRSAPAAQTVTLRLLGRVDGSERIYLSPTEARWEHLWAAPPSGAVLLGEVAWNPTTAPRLANAGATRFLDPQVDFASAELTILHGRDTVGIERGADGLTIHLCDSLPGSALYELELRFQRRAPSCELHLVAVIDGSDELTIDVEGARWTHRHWGWPEGPVRVNGRAWDPRAHAFLANGGPEAFLPPGVDLASARVVERSGRDLAVVESSAEGLVIRFADDPPGAGRYELRIRFDLRPGHLVVVPLSEL